MVSFVARMFRRKELTLADSLRQTSGKLNQGVTVKKIYAVKVNEKDSDQ